MKKVFNIGGVSYNSVIHLDQFPKPVPTTIHHCNFKETVGNTGAGKAVTLSKLDFDVTFHSMIGNDVYGEKIRTYLNKPNLKFIHDIDPQGTERHLNLMNSGGERISIFMNPITDEPNIDYNRFNKEIRKSDFVVVNISNYCRNILPLCKANKIEVWTDLHDYDGKSSYHQDFIDSSDYVFLSSDNLKDYKPFMEKMIDQGKKLVVCTHGKAGACALTKEGWVEVEAITEYRIKDTNGAGDAFFSGFLYGFSKEYSIKKCMQFGTIAGGLCIQSELITNQDLSAELLEKEHLRYY
ncbi:carbohydrate kinase family protein [Aquimarina mytili]|uniref:Carbohydrate kinase family protein n=1 Tax=Aquimarina mytili TaxID=874423 RepID=A0A936ZUL4_9FLAO|nr:carbohydrate kinase family protein [Aquimarina mytili]MBL0682446.1 carbohydrate kinase family protein [Aquimarina mytili]